MSYCNGSDMLLFLEDNAMGHCTSHTTTMNSETKDRAVKPAVSVAKTSGLWKDKGVTGLSISISGEGLIYDGETEESYAKLLKAWKTGASITCKCMERGKADKPYLSGQFVITSLERQDPANDDASFSVNLENDGEPDVLDETAFNEVA